MPKKFKTVPVSNNSVFRSPTNWILNKKAIPVSNEPPPSKDNKSTRLFSGINPTHQDDTGDATQNDGNIEVVSCIRSQLEPLTYGLFFSESD